MPIDNGTHKVPSVLETPVAVTKDNITQYFGNPDYPTKAGHLRREGRGQLREARAVVDVTWQAPGRAGAPGPRP